MMMVSSIVTDSSAIPKVIQVERLNSDNMCTE
jgi:hypothetical protein